MLKGKDFLSLNDVTVEDIQSIFDLTKKLKKEKFSDILKRKTIALIFQKPSTRTRVSFEAGVYQLGGKSIVLGWNELQLGRGETVEDTARVLERYVDAVVARVFFHQDLVKMANVSKIPIVNSLSDFSHPCQGLADLFTIDEKIGLKKVSKITYVGDGNNNVCHSLMFGCSKLGLNLAVGCPKGYEPRKEVIEKTSGIEIVNDPIEAVKDSDVVYTDVWISMGMEKEAEERMKVFPPFQVNKKLFGFAKKDAIFMHCLPAHRGMEVTDEVVDSKNSVVWDQAENRLHTQKALLSLIFS